MIELNCTPRTAGIINRFQREFKTDLYSKQEAELIEYIACLSAIDKRYNKLNRDFNLYDHFIKQLKKTGII